ncbi:MAG TPA: hypothetical protein VN694_04285 [Caulobacteraceae bacterium]|nr:hypothetical protein [Caulobacteraceae bacterium]
MSDGGPWDNPGDIAGEGSAFIVRARLDPAPFQGQPRVLIRLESVNNGTVQHFTDIDVALTRLRELLFGVVRAGGA